VTYDLAVWRHRGPLSDADASVEFERRIDLAEAKALDEADPPSSEVMALFARLRERFPDEPWENSEDEADGDFLYLKCPYPDGPWVEAATEPSTAGGPASRPSTSTEPPRPRDLPPLGMPF